MGKSKMIVKGVAFNSQSQRHMKILDWAMSQTENFSNYLRDLVILDYERNHSKGNIVYSSKPSFNNDEAELMRKLT